MEMQTEEYIVSRVKLLDCTLRDGGYVNCWHFGRETIADTLDSLFAAKIDIVEAGFIRDVEEDLDSAVFPNVISVNSLLSGNTIDKRNKKLAVMAEMSNPIPVDKIALSCETEVDIIRVIVWKTKHLEDGTMVDALQEGFEYCKEIASKGYKVCIQPNRTDQYTDEEFISMIKMFSKIKPYAIYVVDSWGTMYSNQVLHYMDIADSVLPKEIAIGFHGHNNMMQAFSTAEKIIEKKYDRDIILDASIDGIGRGAGNLNLELIARYMNVNCGTDYEMEPMYAIYDKHIKPMKITYSWGSSFSYMLSAIHNANPNYATYFDNKIGLKEMDKAYSSMSREEAVMYSEDIGKRFLA